MRKLITFLSISILLLVTMVVILQHFFRFTPQYPIFTLNKGWTVTYHNQQYINTNLEKLGTKLGNNFSRGDTLTLK